MMGSTPFQLALRPTGRETRFDLFYQYQYQEPGDSGDGQRGALCEARVLHPVPAGPGTTDSVHGLGCVL